MNRPFIILTFAVFIFSKTAAPLPGISYTAQGAGVGKHLVFDLEPGIYRVTRDGAALSGGPFATSAQGTLTFESPGGGVFVVTPAGAICTQPSRPQWTEGNTP